LGVFFVADFLLRVEVAAALTDRLPPNAAAQLSEYFFDAPIRTIVTVVPFNAAPKWLSR